MLPEHESSPPQMKMDNHKEDIGIFEIAAALRKNWRLLTIGPFLGAVIAFGISYLIPPVFTARTVFLPPQQPQGAAASALASLGALSGLSGGALSAVKTTADQYVSLMQSVNVQNQIIKRFDLLTKYDLQYWDQARRELSQNIRINIGKKDGLISLEADAPSPQLAADLANQHVTELRRITGELALTEAQQRRVFFEAELNRTREQLAKAQATLQQGGFNATALKAEPKAAAENYGRLRAEVTAAEVKLQAQRRLFADDAVEIGQQRALLSALQAQLRKVEDAERTQSTGQDADYISRYRDYKYQESLFELFSRQFEVARLDESREGAVIQVIDVATPPERRSRPKRTTMAVTGAAVVFLILATSTMVMRLRRREDSKV